MEEALLSLMTMELQNDGALGAARVWGGAVWDSCIGGLAARASMRRERRGEGGNVMDTMRTDLAYAVRSLQRRPVFAAAAVLTMALGIGANTSVFTVVDGFMLTPLPYDDPEELVAIWAAHPERGWSGTDVSHADALEWRARSTTLADLTVFDEDGFNLTGGDVPELVSALRVTPNFLSVLGRTPTLGRDFRPGEMGEGVDRVVILNDGFWERRFARDPDVLGSVLTLDGEPVTIIGILPADFLFHDGRPDVLRPFAFDAASAPRGNHSASAVARLADGATVELARSELAEIARRLEAEFPENEGWTVEVYGLHEDVVGDVASQASIILMSAVGFILLMACVNVANLLLARAGGRRREIAVRVALGAGRGRVVRQLLTESAVLACLGGVLGSVGATWGYRAIVAALPSTMPPVFQFDIDGSVLGYTAAITLGSAILFGLAPALRASRQDVDALRDGGRSGRSRAGNRFGSALVVLQTAMSAVLLVGGGLLVKSVAEMRNRDLGFDPTDVVAMRVDLPTTEYDSDASARAYWTDVTQRVREVPGVVEAGTVQSAPLEGSNWGRSIRIAGNADDRDRTVRLTLASPGFFEALGYRLAKGRGFDDGDGDFGPRVAVVNEAFVERYLAPNDDPLTTRVTSGTEWSAQVVGVVENAIERAVDRPHEPAMYLPIDQADVRSRTLVVRTSGSPLSVVPAIQEAAWSVDADIPLHSIRTMEDLVDDRIGGFAVLGNLMGVFALLSLLLGAIGIYGVTAYATAQRTGEIGLRLAMGADRGDVVRMVIHEGGRRAAVGLVVGLGLAVLLGSGMAGVLVGVSPRDPWVFGTVTVMLIMVSFVGLYIPARNASRVDPMEALTTE